MATFGRESEPDQQQPNEAAENVRAYRVLEKDYQIWAAKTYRSSELPQ
jgi:hypothetical protein